VSTLQESSVSAIDIDPSTLLRDFLFLKKQKNIFILAHK